jgi:hypothetical protein
VRSALILCCTVFLVGCLNTRTTAPSTSSPVSVTPSSGSGSAQTFTATYKDPNGGLQIAEVTLSIMSNSVLPGSRSKWSANECLLRYYIPTNAIWLVPNMGGTWGYRSIVAGSSSTLSNSQCTVVASGSSAKISGDILAVNLEVTFSTQFAGTKQLYLGSEDGNGNWSADYRRQFGTFTVAATSPLSSGKYRGSNLRPESRAFRARFIFVF